MTSKNLSFLISNPRAGNTLLSSILNQNKRINVTANSITFEILHQLHKIKEGFIFKNFPDHNSFNNVCNNVFKNYYKDWDYDYIIDRSSTALTPENTKYFDYSKYKFIFLKRDIEEVVKSFIKLYQDNGDKREIEKIAEDILNPDLILCRSILSMVNGYKTLNKEQYITINYEEIIEDPKNVIEKIYSFLKIEIFTHRFNNLNQFESNYQKYDDNIHKHSKGMHEIRTDKISKNHLEIDLPKEIRNKCIVLNNLLNNSSSI